MRLMPTTPKLTEPRIHHWAAASGPNARRFCRCGDRHRGKRSIRRGLFGKTAAAPGLSSSKKTDHSRTSIGLWLGRARRQAGQPDARQTGCEIAASVSTVRGMVLESRAGASGSRS